MQIPRAYEDLTNAEAAEMFRAMIAAMLQVLIDMGMEQPKFSLMLFNDPKRGLMTTNVERGEFIREVSQVVTAAITGSIQEDFVAVVSPEPTNGSGRTRMPGDPSSN